MSVTAQGHPTPFEFPINLAEKPHSQFKNMVIKGTEALLGLNRCQMLYEQIDPFSTAGDFAGLALQKLGVSFRIAEHARQRIPVTGPCILIANHPFGGIEGLALFELLAQIRPDCKVMANFMLARIPQLQEQLISVNPFGGEPASRINLAPLRQSLNWLKQGGLLVIFPAGEVSCWQTKGRVVTDPQWSSTLPRLVRLSKAPVLPVFFPGANGPLFQLAGTVHPRLRTALLPRMLLNKRGHVLEIKVGHLLSVRKLGEFNADQNLNDYLRLRTYSLGLKTATIMSSEDRLKSEQIPLIKPPDQKQLLSEIDSLRETNLLLSSGDFDVLLAKGCSAFHLLQEIGRLRELTFRLAGEGTGQSLDLDSFDADYNHLFIWNRDKQEVVGAYRFGQVDQLLSKKGAKGLYTSTLFAFKPQLLERLQQSLELGRSFIRPEYQRSYAPLLLLWKGIGQYLVANPHYRYLFGPVSISNDYSASSRQLMTSTLTRHYLVDGLANLVASKQPVPLNSLKISGVTARQSDPVLKEMDELSALVSDLETDSKGIPVLLRHYLNLGGKLLAFNLDREFSDVIDGLLLVDLQQTDQKQLQRYMGREGLQTYLSAQPESLTRCA